MSGREFAVTPGGARLHSAGCWKLWRPHDAGERSDLRVMNRAEALRWLSARSARRPCADCRPAITALRLVS